MLRWVAARRPTVRPGGASRPDHPSAHSDKDGVSPSETHRLAARLTAKTTCPRQGKLRRSSGHVHLGKVTRVAHLTKEMTAAPELKIAIEDPSQPDIVALLRDGEAHSAKLYPPESNHHMPLSALRAPNLRFLVVRDANGRAVGTGALALNGVWAELK